MSFLKKIQSLSFKKRKMIFWPIIIIIGLILFFWWVRIAQERLGKINTEEGKEDLTSSFFQGQQLELPPWETLKELQFEEINK